MGGGAKEKLLRIQPTLEWKKKKSLWSLGQSKLGFFCLNVILFLDAVNSLNRNKVWITGLGSRAECYTWFAFCTVSAWPWETEETHAKKEKRLRLNSYYISNPIRIYPLGSGVPRLLRGFTASLSLLGMPIACPDSSTQTVPKRQIIESDSVSIFLTEMWVLANQKSASIQLLILLSVSTQCYVAYRAPDWGPRLLWQYFYSAHKNSTHKEDRASSAHLASFSFAHQAGHIYCVILIWKNILPNPSLNFSLQCKHVDNMYSSSAETQFLKVSNPTPVARSPFAYKWAELSFRRIWRSFSKQRGICGDPTVQFSILL